MRLGEAEGFLLVNLALRQPDLSERLAALRHFQNSAKRKLHGRRKKGPCLSDDVAQAFRAKLLRSAALASSLGVFLKSL
jgi:hypothetical protein